jgi:hypothetical protein
MARHRTLFAYLAAAVFLGALLSAGQQVDRHLAGAQAGNALAIDADPATAAVDADIGRPLGVPFAVTVNVTSVAEAYRTYQVYVSWSPASALSFVSGSHLAGGAGYTACGSVTAYAGPPPGIITSCGNPTGVTAYTGPLVGVTLQCDEEGSVEVSLVDLAVSPTFGTTTIGASGNIQTSTTGAQITCGSGEPGPTSTPGAGPTATPVLTPPPEGMEAVALAAGCNPVTSTYADGTPVQTIAGAVAPQGILDALWAFEQGGWLGYSPQFPEVSDLAEVGFLDVEFVCVGAAGSFARPLA